jgi:hypothetical protein
MNKTNAILLLSHQLNTSVLELHEALITCCSKEFDACFLADNSRGLFQRYEQDERFCLFTLNDLQRLDYPGKKQLAYPISPECRNPYHQERNFRMGYTELPLLHFFHSRANYEYYWVVEYDMRFSGNWATLFRYFSNSKADLLTTSLQEEDQVPHWARWESLHLPVGYDTGKRVKAFLPIYRISNQALQRLDLVYRAGAAGHYEALLPSVLSQAGMSLEDLGGDGPFTRAENINRFYQNTPTHDSLAPGTLMFRPVFTEPGKRPDTLWHPVK